MVDSGGELFSKSFFMSQCYGYSEEFGGEGDGLIGRDFGTFAVEGYSYASQARRITLVGA